MKVWVGGKKCVRGVYDPCFQELVSMPEVDAGESFEKIVFCF